MDCTTILGYDEINKGFRRDSMQEPVRLYGFADEASASIDGQISALKKHHMDGLELRGSEYGSTTRMTVEQVKEIRKKLADAGIPVWSIGSAVGKLDIREPLDSHLERFKRILEFADILDAKRIRLFSFYIPAHEDPAQYEGEVLDRMGKLLEQAKGSGVTLCHENEKGIFGDSPERCRKLMDTFPELRTTFDFANYVQCGYDPRDAWKLLKPTVCYLHVKDAKGKQVVPAGKGDGHLKEIIGEYLKDGGRDFTLEPHLWVFDGLEKLEKLEQSVIEASRAYGSAEAAFATAVQAFRTLLEECE